MILYRWQGSARNFGDELNTLLWPRLLPDFFDGDPEVQFLGIGSILDGRHTEGGVKLVAGSGYGGYEPPPRLDQSWHIHWVRGPHTARLLALPLTLGLGDPASLLPQAGETVATGGTGIGFMPHFESAAHGAWAAAALAADVQLIDPRDDPVSVIAAIRSCRVVLSEALHGVIVADALRVPWVAIEPLAPIHRPKWHDWAETLDLRIAFRRLSPSSLLEHARSSRMADYHAGRRLLVRHAGRLKDLGSERFLARAVGSLVAAAGAEPQLSDPSALDRSQSRMMERLAALRQDAAHPYVERRRRVGAGVRPADLRACDDSAYQPGLIG
jgi:succinoglycan biosynthesis protein ExoV